MADAPQAALDYLKAHPGTEAQFQERFGYLPEGHELPEAPAAAMDFLEENPDTAPQFKQKYGYLPAPEAAMEYLRANPDTADQFKAKFGYLPKAEKSIGDRIAFAVDAWRTSRKEKLIKDQRAAASAGPTMGVSDSGYMGDDGKWYDAHQPKPQSEQSGIVSNSLRAAGERAGDLFGNLLRSGGITLKAVANNPEALKTALTPIPLVGAAASMVPNNVISEASQAVGAPLDAAGKSLTRLDLNHVPTHTWQKLKQEFSEGGPLSGSSWAEVAKYATGQGIQSIPDMVAVLTALPAYITSTSVEMGANRAKNKGKQDVELTDALEAMPFAVGSALLEKIGAKGMTQDVIENVGKDALKEGFLKAATKEGFKAGTKEALTEFGQGILQYVGERFGTKAKMTLKEGFDQALAGAVAGFGMGGAVGGAVHGTVSVAEAWSNSLKESLPEAATESQKAADGNPTTEAPAGEERRAAPTEGPRERRQGENEVQRQETEDILQQYRATQQAVKDGTATQADLDRIAERALTMLYEDKLTGLQNFRAYQAYIAKHPDHAIAKLDLDGFKELNDRYGHEGADGILRAVGAVLSRMGKEMNVLPFRTSTSGKGDEFAVMGPDPAVLKTFGKAVQDELDSTTLDITNEKGEQVTHPSIGVSYGVASNPGAAETALKADKAARKASGKRQGLRDTPVEGAPDMAASAGVPAGESAGGGTQAANDTQAAAPGVVEGAATDSAPVTSEQIQAAKPNLPAEERPSSTAYSGLALDRMGDHIANAARRLMDKLGIAKEGVEVEKSGDSEAQPGPMSLLWSPSKLVKKYPKLAKYLNFARGAFETQEGLRNAFRTRLKKIDDILKEGDIFGSLSDTYRKNKRTLKEIRLTEDALGKSLTAQQMKDDFGASPAVIKAHMMMRATYNHAWTILSKTRELRGKLPPSFREGYLPHMFHNYFVIQEHPLPPGAAGPPHSEIVGSGRTIAEAVALGNQFKRLGGTGNIKIRQKHFKFPGEDVQAAVVGDIEYFQMQRKLEKDFELTHEEAQEMMDTLAHRKGRSRFFGNLLERKGVKGWEQDLDWVDRRYFNMVARYAALDRFKSKSITAFEREFGKFDADKQDLAQYVKDYINDINGTPTYLESMLNNGLRNKFPGLNKFLGHYLGDRPILQLANGWANATAIAKLGFLNPASALINSTQLLGAYSVLGEKHFMVGNGLAMKALSGKGKGASTLRGILKQAGVDTDLSLSSAAGYSSNAPLGKLLNMTMFAFTSMEKYVRATTVLGAYRKAIAGGASHKEAIEFAKGVNERVNFNYGVIDAPNFIRRSGPAGTIEFQFKKFPVKMMEFMLSQNPKEMARFWIPMFLIAGMYAIPGGEALKELIKAATSKDGYGGWDAELELKRWLMKWAGDDPEKQRWANVVMYGAFSNAGVDISRRVGGSDFIPTRPSDFVGAGPSSLWRAVQYGMQGDWAEALRSVATSPGNVAVALSQNGKFSRSADNRDRPSAKASPGDIAKKALGFRPYEESKENDVARIIAYENERYRRTQNEIVDGIIESTLRYNETVAALDQQAPPSTREPLKKEAKEEYDREIADIVKAIAKNGIVVTPDQVLNEIKNKNLTPSQRAFLNASDVIKARNSRVYMFANGSFGHED